MPKIDIDKTLKIVFLKIKMYVNWLTIAIRVCKYLTMVCSDVFQEDLEPCKFTRINPSFIHPVRSFHPVCLLII